MASLFENQDFRVLLYVAVALVCVLAGLANRRYGSKREFWFWVVVALLLVGYAVFKQAGYESKLIDEGRHLIKSEGLYEDRRFWQAVLIGAITGGSIVAFLVTIVAILIIFRRPTVGVFLGMLTMAGLTGFLIVRAISQHYVDAFMYRRSFQGVHYGALGEVTLTFAVATAALIAISAAYLRAPRQVKQPPAAPLLTEELSEPS